MQISLSALEASPERRPSAGYPGPPRPPGGAGSGRPRRRPHRVASLALLTAIVAIASTVGVITTAQRQVDEIERIPGLAEVFSPGDANIENFLLVGSDTRAGADPNDPDFGGIGGEGDVSGNRSDTIMILRRDRRGGPASLLSLPRDLWVDIPGRGEQRINVAYQDGPATLIRTVQSALGIPVHHYVEVDFQGFKSLVDAIGGVEICFDTPARDVHTGLYIELPGCHVLNGVQGLQYTRSRYYETWVDDGWRADPTSDLGRIKRQQGFINTALQAALARVKGNPLEAGEVLVSTTGALRIDDDLDVLAAADALRDAVGDGLQTYSPPVVGRTISGNAVLVLGDGAPAFLDYFRGVSATPPPSA